MTKYPEKRKQAILKKMLAKNAPSLAILAKEEGIHKMTLARWKKEALAASAAASSDSQAQVEPKAQTQATASNPAASKKKVSKKKVAKKKVSKKKVAKKKVGSENPPQPVPENSGNTQAVVKKPKLNPGLTDEGVKSAYDRLDLLEKMVSVKSRSGGINPEVFSDIMEALKKTREFLGQSYAVSPEGDSTDHPDDASFNPQTREMVSGVLGLLKSALLKQYKQSDTVGQEISDLRHEKLRLESEVHHLREKIASMSEELRRKNAALAEVALSRLLH